MQITQISVISYTPYHDGSGTATHRECPVVEPVVLAALEEVRVPVAVLKGGVQVVGDSLPVGQRFGICALDGRFL